MSRELREQLDRARSRPSPRTSTRSTACSTSATCGRSSSCRASPSCATRRGRRSPSRACRPQESERRRRHGRDARGRHPRAPPLRLVRDLGRALRRAGRRRPRRARDQADRVPHVRRLAARAGADPRDRARQAGGLPGRAQGALRRAREHQLGARAGGGGRARRLRPARRSRRTPSASSSCAARATACATTCTSAPATTTPRPRGCTPTSACSRCDERIGADVADMFNFLTGFARPRRYRKVLVAPAHLRDGILDEIERTIEAHEEGEHARIALKMNSLVDRRCIRALYRASQAGVPVELNVRGICCLRPGVPGVSENIRVVSIVGRFLEHSRDLRLRARRRAARSHRLGRPDAAQPRHARRAHRAGRDADACATTCSTRSSAASPTTRTRGSCGQDGSWTRRTPRARSPATCSAS